MTTAAPAPAGDEERLAADERRNELDVATIRALRSGEMDPNAAWTDLMSRHRRRLFSLAYRFTGRFHEAEELTHEIIVRVFHNLDRFDPRAHFAVWLNSVARNYCIDRYRMRTREKARFLPEAAPFERMAGRPQLDPNRLVEQREARDDLREALERLSPKLREVVRLRFFEELPYEEICDRLGIPEGTVKSRIHRGRAELKRHLAEVQRPAREVRTPPKGRTSS